MDKIAVLDFGGQYAHLIANRVRRLNVYSEILEAETPASELKKRGYKGIILSGGPQSVYDEDAVKCDPEILNLGVPLLGICYGHQVLAYIQGAVVEPANLREFGLAEVDVLKSKGIFEGLGPKETVWMSHGDSVKTLPPGYEVIGASPGENAAIANFEKNFYGFQFHAEVTHSVNGMKMYDNFLKICGVSRDWKIENFIDEEMEKVRAQVGDKKVFMLVSGGVDSTVAFVLLAKALGPERVFGLFIDTGFLRLGERDQVSETLKAAGFNNLHVKDASKVYFEKLKGVYDPEAKRKIIGDMFLNVQEQVVEELGLNPEEWLLGQGTIYPDTIESGGTKHAAKIKTHHNRVARIEELISQGRVIEPLAQLYKDEVRFAGEKLGLSSHLVWRHPFPGPGLAVRCLCAQEETYPHNHVLVENQINEELQNSLAEERDIDESVEVLGVDLNLLRSKILPIKSVGVQGDFRSYKHPLALIGEADFDSLERLATVLINQHSEINRVIWLCSPIKIESMRVQKSYLVPERIKLLQQADDMVMKFIIKHGLDRRIWQFPTVLIPLVVNRDFGESIVLRPVESEEAMTANFFHMDQKLLKQLAADLMKISGITAVFYDVTNKPPGTIEWE